MERFMKIHYLDNVLVAVKAIKQGDEIVIDGKRILALDDIEVGHKISINDLIEGDHVIKYGNTIGLVKSAIKSGALIHSHNLGTDLGENNTYSYNFSTRISDCPIENATFNGYFRDNGEVGIRNELWIVPTVGCVNGQAALIADRLKKEKEVSHLDDVIVMSHQYGCSQLGDDHINTQKALAALIKHPNAGGVLVLGLGCENNQINELKKVLGEFNASRVRFITSQEVEDEVEEGFKMVCQLSEQMKADKRTIHPLSKLRIGLKCGGSDAFSGITANPLIGHFSDWLIAQGGTTVLTEVPEMFGAEEILMNRAQSRKVFEETVHLINGFKDYFRFHNQPIYENPSPGNKVGGITTLEEKSLGCIQKGGQSIVNDVLDYTDPITKNGLNLLWSPGNDMVASAALGFSGCHMVLFTTGRGTPFGSFIPTLKVSSNSGVYNRKKNWIDFDAGRLLDNKTMDQLLQDFISFIIEVINGRQLKHEATGVKEIAIFKSGVTL